MRVPLSRFLSRRLRPAAALLGPPTAAWGGYGLGVAAGGPPLSAQTLAAAGLVAGGAALVLPLVRRRGGDGGSEPGGTQAPTAGSFPENAAVLETLAPAVAAHPDGLTRLRALADLLFEVHHPAPADPAVARATAAPVTNGGAE